MKILVINPGSTTTKIAVFEEEQELFNETIKHSPEDLDKYEKVFEQVDYRKAAILELLAEKGYQLTDFDAVSGRGGMYRPIPGGTYAVNDRVLEDVKTAPYGEHASNIGAYLARLIGDMVGIPSFFVDPPLRRRDDGNRSRFRFCGVPPLEPVPRSEPESRGPQGSQVHGQSL